MEAVTEIKKGYKKTKVGWIPEDWKVLKIKELSINGTINGLYKPIELQGKGCQQVNMKELFRDDVISNSIPMRMIVVSEKEKDKFLLKEGDLLFARRSLALEGVGKCSIVGHLTKPTTFESSIIKITLEKKIIYPKILFYYLQTNIGKNKILALARQVAVSGITGKDLLTYPVPIPPLPEQQKIAKILSTWDKAIEQSQNLIEQLKSRKKGLMQQLLTGKTRLKGFSGEWKEVKLEEYFTQRSESNKVELPLLSVGINGVYPQDNSIKKDTSNSDKSKYKRICVGDIGYNTMRMWQGRSALSNLEGIVSPAYTIVTPKDNADSLFFSYLFKLDYVVHRFYRYSQGLVSDTWQCRFNDFIKVKVMGPPTIEEQQAIAKVLTTAGNEIKTQETYLKQLQDQKKGLMQQLLTGQKRVNI